MVCAPHSPNQVNGMVMSMLRHDSVNVKVEGRFSLREQKHQHSRLWTLVSQNTVKDSNTALESAGDYKGVYRDGVKHLYR